MRKSRDAMLAEVQRRHARYVGLFGPGQWTEDLLSDGGWLGLVAVPWLLAEVRQDGNSERDQGNSNGNPGANGIGLALAPLEFVHAQQSSTRALVVPTGNPIAKFLVGHFAKLVGVSFVAHHLEPSVRTRGVNPASPEKAEVAA